MDSDEKKWIDDAMDICSRAKERGIAVLLVRFQDDNNEHNVVVASIPDGTNAKGIADALYQTYCAREHSD